MLELNYGKMQVHGEILVLDDPHKVGTKEEEEKGSEVVVLVVVVLAVVVPVLFRMMYTDLSHHHVFVCLHTCAPIHQLISGKIITGKGTHITINMRNSVNMGHGLSIRSKRGFH